MDLTSYVDNLRRDLAVAAEAGGDEARALAERLTAPLESAVRLTLLDVLSAAAAEITRDLAPGSVDLRLRDGDPSFVVTPAPGESDYDDPIEPRTPTPPTPETDGGTSRINFRLPDALKARIEEAATREGLSVNAWLGRTVAAGLDGDISDRRPGRRSGRVGQSYSGWVR